jgi:hypothetical protein
MPSTSRSSTSCAQPPVSLLPRIVLGGPRTCPQSLTQHGMIPLAVSHRTSLLWHGKPSVRLSTPASSPATLRAASSAMVLGPPLILASMRSSSPHLHAPRSHLKHLLPSILLPPSMYSTALVTPLMKPFGIRISKRALPRLCMKSSVRRTLFLSYRTSLSLICLHSPSLSYEALAHLNSPDDLVGCPRYALAAHWHPEGVLQIARWKDDCSESAPSPHAPFTPKAQTSAGTSPGTQYQGTFRGSRRAATQEKQDIQAGRKWKGIRCNCLRCARSIGRINEQQGGTIRATTQQIYNVILT